MMQTAIVVALAFLFALALAWPARKGAARAHRPGRDAREGDGGYTAGGSDDCGADGGGCD